MNPDYLDFVEERLELGIDYGVVGGTSFKTEVIETSDGREQRNSLWWLPLGRWQLGDRVLAESQREMMNEVAYLKQFHADRKGSKQGFRFKDWADYFVVDQKIGIGDGIQTQWQLKKTYRAGSHYCDRPIIKPVFGTIYIYLDGQAIIEWTVDISTGVITFDNSPAVDVVITADFEFDVPVCFETDEIGFNLQGYEDLGDGEYDAIYKLESLFVEEIRINPSLPWAIEPQPEQLDATLDLGIVYETIESTRFDTSKEQFTSGFARRDSNYPVAKTEIKLGNRILDREELDRLLGFFWCAKGKATSFLVNNQQSYFYFSEDSLNIKFQSFQSKEAFFNLNNLNFVERFKNRIYLGFSASSGAYRDTHEILEASFNNIDLIDTSIRKQLNGSTQIFNNLIQLNNSIYTAGSVYFFTPVNLSNLQNLDVFFKYRISGGESDRGEVADGLAFVIQASSFTALTNGGGIGYLGIEKSVIVEFDTYENPSFQDPNNNHVGITINGNNVIDSNYVKTPTFDIRGERFCWIVYNKQSLNLEVYLSEINLKPENPLVVRPINWKEIFYGVFAP